MAGEGARAWGEACCRPVSLVGGVTLRGGVSSVSAESEAEAAGKFARGSGTDRRLQRARRDFLHSISHVSPCSSPAELEDSIAAQPSTAPAPLDLVEGGGGERGGGRERELPALGLWTLALFPSAPLVRPMAPLAPPQTRETEGEGEFRACQ